MKTLIATANENEIAVANAAGEVAFEIQQDGRWFVPFGSYPHAKGTQLWTKEAAEVMQRVFNSLTSRVGRFFNKAAVPIYRGHPDVPGRPDSNPAAPASGWIEGITVENDGAFFDVKLNDDGERAVRNREFRFYSPHWNCRAVKGGIQPVQLLSFGLTNNPRIPVPAIANDSTQHTQPMIKKLLKLLGFAEDATPDDAAVSAACDAITTQIETATATANDLTTQVATLTGERDEARTQLATANDRVTAIEAELAAANDAATERRRLYVEGAADGFVLTGRRTAAERDALRDELLAIENDADLAARIAAIRAETPRLKTGSQTKELGAAKSKVVSAANDEAERSAQRREAIAEEARAIANDTTQSGLTPGARYDRAFARAKAKHPNLFPEPKAKA